MKPKAFLLLLMLLPLMMLSQNRIKDTVYGNVKSVREKLIFLDSVRQTYKLFDIEGDYGHHGFMSREFTMSRFNTFWYTLPFTHYMNYYREYNHKNQITTETWYYKDNSFLTKYEFAYDEKGNLVEEKESDEFGEVITKKWGYDHANRMATLLKSYKEWGGFTFLGYQYNRAGELIATTSYHENEKVNDRKFEYESGRVVRVYHTLPYKLTAGNDPNHKTKVHGEWDTYLYEEYKYDEHGNKTIVTNYSSVIEGTNDAPAVTTYFYDSNNNMVSNSNSPWVFTYDSKSRLILEKNSINGKTYIDNKYTYKGNNLIKLLYTENGKTTTVTFSYKFDSHNNWIEQTKSINGKPLYVRRREIVYY